MTDLSQIELDADIYEFERSRGIDSDSAKHWLDREVNRLLKECTLFASTCDKYIEPETVRLQALLAGAKTEEERDAREFQIWYVKTYLTRAAELGRARLTHYRSLETQADFDAELAKCSVDKPYWFKYYAWGYDPRARTPLSVVPFDLYPRQVELVNALDDAVFERKTSLLIEKARDEGATELIVRWGVHNWRFRESGFSMLLSSRTEDEVDTKKKQGTLFERARFQLRRLPSWMRPKDFDIDKHLLPDKLIANPNGNALIGQAPVENMGRGDRVTCAVFDEFAFWRFAGYPQFRSMSQTTDSIIMPSSVAGKYNQFADLAADGVTPKFEMDWRAQPLDAKIVTPFGWKRMGDISVGDPVLDVDGRPARVTAITPHGTKPVFRVSLCDGSSTECCEDHLWTVIPSSNQYVARRHITKTLPLKDLINDYKGTDSRGFARHRYQLPMPASAQFEPVELPLDPYILGCLLGDGSISAKPTTAPLLTVGDEEIIEHCRKRLPPDCYLKHDRRIHYRFSAGPSYRGVHGRGTYSPICKAIRDLGLVGSVSHTKFIPDVYKLGSTVQRLDLLRGLMDTDGHCPKNAKSQARLSTTSKQLAEDVAEVARSLGGTAKIYTFCPPPTAVFPDGRICTRRDEAYNVNVKLPPGMVPFLLSRKVALFGAAGGQRKPRRSIVSIEPSGEKPVQCITVDREDGLYLTDDYIVTHNCNPFKDRRWYSALSFGFIGPKMSRTTIAQEVDRNYSASQPGKVWTFSEPHSFITQSEFLRPFEKAGLRHKFFSGDKFIIPTDWRITRTNDYGQSEGHDWAHLVGAQPRVAYPLHDTHFIFIARNLEPNGLNTEQAVQQWSKWESDLGLRDPQTYKWWRDSAANYNSHEQSELRDVLMVRYGENWTAWDTDYETGIATIGDWLTPVDVEEENPFRSEIMGRNRLVFVAPDSEYMLAYNDRLLEYFVTVAQSEEGFNLVRKQMDAYAYPITELGKPVAKMRPRKEFDDIVDCCPAGTNILTRRGEIPIEVVTTDDLAMTRQGWRPVTKSQETAKQVSTYTVTDAEGRTVTATGNHKIYTVNRGWVALRGIAVGDMLLTWQNQNALFSMASGITATPTRRDGPIARILRRGADICTLICGRLYADLSLTATTFITKITTIPTTFSRILNASLLPNTDFAIARNASERVRHPSGEPIWMQCEPFANPQPRNSGTRWVSAPRGCGEIVSPMPISALFAEQSFKARQCVLNIVPTPVNGEILSQDGNHTKDRPITPASCAAKPLRLFSRLRAIVRRSAEQITIRLRSRRANAPSVESPSSTRSQKSPSVRAVAVAGVTKDSKRVAVYNLNVAECPEYFANGILVHNCVRGYAVNWNRVPKGFTPEETVENKIVAVNASLSLEAIAAAEPLAQDGLLARRIHEERKIREEMGRPMVSAAVRKYQRR